MPVVLVASVVAPAPAAATAAAPHPSRRRSGGAAQPLGSLPLSLLLMLLLAAAATPSAAAANTQVDATEYSEDDGGMGTRSADESGNSLYDLSADQAASTLGLPAPPDSQLVHLLLKLLAPHLAPVNNNDLEDDYTSPKTHTSPHHQHPTQLSGSPIVPSTQHLPKGYPWVALQRVQDIGDLPRPMKRQ
ncbi:unnamed protein product, partial [Meganyctiphanes norvegica]